MSVLTSLGIIILAIFACAFLQLTPSVFLIFYHYASARFSREKLLDFSSFFVVGTASMTATLLFLMYFSIFHFILDNPTLDLTIVRWGVAGVLFALGLFSIFFYYRKGPGTRLFISRKMAKKITTNARGIRKTSDAFALGMTIGILELLFTFPIYLVAITEIVFFPSDNVAIRPLLLFVFTIATMFPLLTIRGQFFRFHKNLADIERSREKNKLFTRLMIGSSYILLAVLLICFRIF